MGFRMWALQGLLLGLLALANCQLCEMSCGNALQNAAQCTCPLNTGQLVPQIFPACLQNASATLVQLQLELLETQQWLASNISALEAADTEITVLQSQFQYNFTQLQTCLFNLSIAQNAANYTFLYQYETCNSTSTSIVGLGVSQDWLWVPLYGPIASGNWTGRLATHWIGYIQNTTTMSYTMANGDGTFKQVAVETESCIAGGNILLIKSYQGSPSSTASIYILFNTANFSLGYYTLNYGIPVVCSQQQFIQGITPSLATSYLNYWGLNVFAPATETVVVVSVFNVGYLATRYGFVGSTPSTLAATNSNTDLLGGGVYAHATTCHNSVTNDLMIATNSSGVLSYWNSESDVFVGQFQNFPWFQTAGIAVADLNNDGSLDLVAASTTVPPQVVVLLTTNGGCLRTNPQASIYYLSDPNPVTSLWSYQFFSAARPAVVMALDSMGDVTLIYSNDVSVPLLIGTAGSGTANIFYAQSSVDQICDRWVSWDPLTALQVASEVCNAPPFEAQQLAAASVLATNLQSQVTTLNQSLNNLPTLEPTLTVPPVLAMGVRKIIRNYQGNAMRIQRSTDGAQTDVPFTAKGDLNTSFILNFVGLEATAYVTTLYDQTGNNNHARQTAATILMPYIATQGYITRINGLPTIVFNGTTSNTFSIGFVTAYPSLFFPYTAITAASIVFEIFANATTFNNNDRILGRTAADVGIHIASNGPSGYFEVANVVANGNCTSNGGPVVAVPGAPAGSAPLSFSLGQISCYPTEPQSVNTLGGGDTSINRAFVGAISEAILWGAQTPAASDVTATFDSQQQYYNLLQPENVLLNNVNIANQRIIHSVRKYYLPTSSQCMNVRRSSDGTTLIIGFNTTNDLDVATLLAFVGSGNGTVQTWFDQVGSANLVQNNVTNQPFIVVNGVLNTVNGRPALLFLSSQQSYLQAAFSHGSSDQRDFLVWAATKNTTGGLISYGDFVNGDTGNGWVAQALEAGSPPALFSFFNQTGAYQTCQIPVGRLQSTASVMDGANQWLYRNGQVTGPSSPGMVSPLSTFLTMGARIGPNPYGFADVNIAEHLLYSPGGNNQNTEPGLAPWSQTTVQLSQASYFAIAPSELVETLPTYLENVEITNGLGTDYMALSVRRAVGSYQGACMNVRRTSDGTAMDIPFNTAGNLDLLLLSTFVGTGNGSVAILYDQSGNGFNAVQTNASSQPLIVINGMVQTSYNSKPTIVFIASLGHYWAVNGFTITGSSLYANTVCSLSSLAVAGQRLLSASSGTTVQDSAGTADAAVLIYSTGSTNAFEILRSSSSATDGYHNVETITNNAVVQVSSWVNGTAMQVSAAGSGTAGGTTTITSNNFNINTVNIGRGIASSTTYWSGTLQELFFSPQVPTSLVQNQLLWSQEHFFAPTTITANEADGVQTASLALGLRQLVSNYAGPLFQMQRSLDGATQDVYGDPMTGAFNQSAVLAFAAPFNSSSGASNITISKWYDQSTNKANATQPVVASQPLLLHNGLFNLVNGQPCPFYSATAPSYMIANLSFVSSTMTLGIVLVPDSVDLTPGTSYPLTFGNASLSPFSNNGFMTFSVRTGATPQFCANRTTSGVCTGTFTSGIAHTYTVTWSATTATAAVDLVTAVSVSSAIGALNFTQVVIGSVVNDYYQVEMNGPESWNNGLCEIILYAAAESTSDIPLWSQRFFWGTP